LKILSKRGLIATGGEEPANAEEQAEPPTPRRGKQAAAE